jgi:hypothetical protein
MKQPPMTSSSDAVAVNQMFAAAYRITRPEALDLHDKHGIFSVMGNYGGLNLRSYESAGHNLSLESRAQVQRYSPVVSHLNDGPAIKPVHQPGGSVGLYNLLSQSNYQPNAQYQ